MNQRTQLLLKPLLISTLLLSVQSFAVPATANKAAPGMELKPYSASYKASIKGIPFGGSGERNLKKNSDGSWTLEFGADAAFFGMKETSHFTLKNHKVVSLDYVYKRSGIGSKPEKEAHFDWNTHKVTWHQDNRQWSMDLPAGAIDNLAYQLQLRIDLSSGKTTGFNYKIADDDEVFERAFIVEGDEIIETDAGKLETIKIKIQRDSDKRTTWIWFAKNWNYFMVKLLQKEGDTEYSIEFKEATIDGKQLTGKI
ncbi:hypothetical protein ACH42_16405 [Endozoicomonas sp. (ex Bugula neritina AB1)]|nr:hypothetical protein ACH42_16405 [Endozoicomonas sp. (ex Bugula neritina AB1)]